MSIVLVARLYHTSNCMLGDFLMKEFRESWKSTGWPIKIKPHRNSYYKSCVKMRALQQWNKLFIVNLSLFLGTVCICRPTLKKR